jgi:hypothetical protein
MAGLRSVMWLLALAACSANQTSNEDRNNAAAPVDSTVKLASSVQVEVGANEVRLVFHITNPSNQPVVLEFSSGQRYDFAVRNAAGDVWRWSAARSFMQALGTETIPPGGSLRYSETWPSGERTGTFTATAQLTSLNYTIEQRAEFEIRQR